MPNLKTPDRLRGAFEQSWRSKDGHPDPFFTEVHLNDDYRTAPLKFGGSRSQILPEPKIFTNEIKKAAEESPRTTYLPIPQNKAKTTGRKHRLKIQVAVAIIVLMIAFSPTMLSMLPQTQLPIPTANTDATSTPNSLQTSSVLKEATSSTPPPTPSPITITGRVIGEDYGSTAEENVSGVEIRVLDSEGNEVATNKTNSTGCFSFSNLSYGYYAVQINVPSGWIPKSATQFMNYGDQHVEFRIQNLLVRPKTMHYNYTLRGVSSQVTFTVYGGMYDYLVSHENSTVMHDAETTLSSQEVERIITLRYINEATEKVELHNLVSAIQQITPIEDDQVRIAISLVQNIPYAYGSISSFDWKYPYEILYLNQGVCSEKSMLLVCLLRELGYGCSILEFTVQNHAAVGLTSPTQYAYYSNYAFVETTAPTIITYWQGDYAGGIKLPSAPAYVIDIQQDGKVMNSISEEYQDAQTYLSLINMGPVLDQSHYAQWQAIVSKYGL